MQLLLAQPILESYPAQPQVSARLRIILAGHDPSSELYVAIKTREAQKYGVTVDLRRFESTATNVMIEAEIQTMNNDLAIDGIILQLPLPGSLDTNRLILAIDPTKDVDGLTNSHTFMSPMVQAVASLIKEYKINLDSKRIVIIGAGRLVGTPIHDWLVTQGCEATIVDELTELRDSVIKAADILFCGSGQKYVVNSTNTRPDQVIFDCSGVDVDFEAIKNTVRAITPPKGSIGPLTVHFLLLNTKLSASNR